ncbi:hypothetical protein L873DRAFT_1690582 [Choiromyces venosus 120613-1]|uniref:Uncharacterized protein n=1 Tax=Choiromyces venosus 120613-1 TaxID=1336337 RepID=A0A3N4JH26_9PEZI|nr:hypothetical protein L873DRAFT_1690582 [Choiromyces venosus 120613-1]
MRPLLSRIIPLLLLSIVILSILFATVYLPQVALLTLFHGPLAWINAAFMVLTEAATLITFVAENFMTEGQIVDTFDAVLMHAAEKSNDAEFREHIYALVHTARDIHPEREGAIAKLGEHRKSPYLRFSCRLTMEFICELPLNFIPLVGAPLFLMLQGYHLGPLSHYRYMQLNDLHKKEKKKFIILNRWRYWLFGLPHVGLQVFPVLSILFLFTSATGAGLWAVEDQKRLFYGTTRSGPSTRPQRPGQGERKRSWWWWKK